jgi:putative modified peptide
MANTKGNGPKHPLDQKIVRKLLDLLTTDDDFRALFQRDAHAALVEAGWVPPPGTSPDDDMAALSSGSCLQLADGATLASKEQIMQERVKLEQSLNAVVNFLCPQGLQAE